MEGKEKGMDRWVNEWVKDGVTGGGGGGGDGGGGGGGGTGQLDFTDPFGKSLKTKQQSVVSHANIFGLFIVD
ncbi:unnamed protein product [Brugia pahangi]|uniref:Uncharacterized protein n=1 Tax=Brugia pahangi TaxID=6280 RepID=A0A0N4TRD6_BRUPA|nr:unnamed protein product [Brugia pahangi]